MRYLSFVLLVLLVGCANQPSEIVPTATSPTSQGAAPSEAAPNPKLEYFDRPAQALYVANSGAATVTVIDVESQSVVGEIQVGLSPISLLHDPDRNRIYVANYGLSSISVIDLERNVELKRVRVSVMPIGMALVADGSELWVASLGSDSIAIIDADRLTISGAVTLPNYVPTEAPPTCCVDPLGTLMTIERGPVDLAVGDDPNLLYVSLLGSSEVAVVDVQERAVRQLFPTLPGMAQVVPMGSELLLASHGLPDLPSRQVLLADRVGEIVGSLPTGEMPAFVLPGSTEGTAWVAAHGSHQVHLVDVATRMVIETFSPGLDPRHLALNGPGDLLFVSNTGEDTVAIVKLPELETVAKISVGIAPRGVLSVSSSPYERISFFRGESVH